MITDIRILAILKDSVTVQPPAVHKYAKPNVWVMLMVRIWNRLYTM